MAGFIDYVKLFVDGGCRGNPGPGAIGVLIVDNDGNQLRMEAECIGVTTNNRAEYRALIKGLDLCAKHTRRRVIVYSDSELVVNHMNEQWRLKDDTLRELWKRVKQCEQVFKEVVYTHVRRTNPFIRKVDRALKEALEGR